jgi:molybdopterin converting factor small subunit
MAVARIPDMERGSASGEAGETAAAMPRVEVRYWAAAKAAAGVPADTVEARTVADALDAVRDLHRDSARFAQVVSICSFLLDERPLGGRDRAALAGVALADGAVLDVLPPFAGGAEAIG